MLEILSLPFMQRALIAGIVLAITLSLLGVFATLKRMAFFGDGIAHASLAGIAIGILTGMSPLWMALFISVLFATVLYILERKTSLSSDAAIGILFTASMALGIILMSLKQGYQPELVSFLFGNIITIGTVDVLIMGIVGTLVTVFLLVFLRPLALLVLDRDEAWLSGIATGTLEFLLYIILAISVVLGVKILGVVLVSALLIIPPTTAKLFARSFQGLVLASALIGLITVIVGLFASYFFDFPSGATIILVGTIFFFLVAITKSIQTSS